MIATEFGGRGIDWHEAESDWRVTGAMIMVPQLDVGLSRFLTIQVGLSENVGQPNNHHRLKTSTKTLVSRSSPLKWFKLKHFENISIFFHHFPTIFPSFHGNFMAPGP